MQCGFLKRVLEHVRASMHWSSFAFCHYYFCKEHLTSSTTKIHFSLDCFNQSDAIFLPYVVVYAHMSVFGHKESCCFPTLDTWRNTFLFHNYWTTTKKNKIKPKFKIHPPTQQCTSGCIWLDECFHQWAVWSWISNQAASWLVWKLSLVYQKQFTKCYCYVILINILGKKNKPCSCWLCLHLHWPRIVQVFSNVSRSGKPHLTAHI